MRKLNLLFWLWLLMLVPTLVGQQVERQELNVPMIESGVINLDGVMDEGAWQTAAEVNMVTSSEYNIWINYYGREGLTEPEYDEYYARLLWTKDTLYAFIHMDEIVNDSSGLWWNGQWIGDQLFVSLSNRFAVPMGENYDGNVYAAPDGPYHYLIMGSDVTLNAGSDTHIPEEWRKCLNMSDSQKVFMASDYARSGITIDSVTGIWNLELAIYHPHVDAQAAISFNIGGSQGSWQHDIDEGDAYAYYTWLPSVPNDPFTDPGAAGVSDPGAGNLINSDYWAVLRFEDGGVRKEMEVPVVDPNTIMLDAQMNETAWSTAAQVNLVTSSAYGIWINYYGREGLTEPEFDEYYARLLWMKDTLYAFIHMDEIVNDSSGLWWGGQWLGDQLFVSLSNRFGMPMGENYDGNVYAAPDGPYHYLIMGDQVTLNNNGETNVPEEWRGCFEDSIVIFNASEFARWAISIDSTTGIWNLELAIYHPNVDYQATIGFNVGGSQGSWQHDIDAGDAYAYYTWLPSVANDPFTDPGAAGVSDPGGANLVNSEYWAALTFVTHPVGVKEEPAKVIPNQYSLFQNYPNPFNPVTTIRFEVPKSGNVTLKVYNVVGEEMATLVNREMSPGIYSASFDASQLSSGVYFYELKSDGVIQTKKMMLLK